MTRIADTEPVSVKAKMEPGLLTRRGSDDEVADGERLALSRPPERPQRKRLPPERLSEAAIVILFVLARVSSPCGPCACDGWS
jgi:hypothetical protein